MELQDSRLVVTGGGGFVGSHLCERLVEDNDVVVADRFSNGDRSWVPDACTVVEGDLTDPDVVAEAIDADVDAVFHLAADKAADRDELAQFRLNNALSENVIERMDEVGVDRLAFTSSSTVYGEAPRPTPEGYAPLEPISVYGASKLASEALGSVYGHSHGFTVRSFRFANIVGPRLQLGAVIPDFLEKLVDDPTTLTILGDGRQEKSYMHVEDCVGAIRHVVEHTGSGDDADAGGSVHTYNLGTRTTTSVRRIADIVCEEMGVDPDYEFTGGRQGWTGDVPRMRLSIEKLSALGFEPREHSDAAVRRAVRELLSTYAPAYT
jgi:UDP-glucose 4-epimerase